ncbi:MAG TPA: phosphate regulon sensor histidine kinase PhoR [Steroidobacteraceae bacterium]|nr:phosphate regulon sensor histidine kinase PhoR [Steroidobacteraceae bacterium]HRX88869.1 phosphate regulon sensor histidine kinase PhoR [Steroidobacteraceae bacterium]
MPPGAKRAIYVLVRLLAAVVVGALLGLVFGHVWAGVAAALAGYLAWQLWLLISLDAWLRNRRAVDPPDIASGVWGDVVTQVVRLHRRKRFHKDRVMRVLRELRRSTAAMPDGVVVLNGDNEILWFNQKAGEYLGLTRKADLGLRIDNLVRHPEFNRYLHSGQYTLPAVVRVDPGADRYLAFQLVRYGEGQRLLMVRDVSRQVRLELMRKDFVANASHELRSPLTVISGYLETLASEPSLPPDIAEPLGEMRRQSVRMTQIIENLLVLSRLEATEGQVAGESVDVAEMLSTLRKDVMARPVHPAKVDLQIESDARLVADEAQLHSAFMNLLDNAAKYTPASGSVTLRWWHDAHGGHFSVIDTGPGIAHDHIPRLTERFYRVDVGRSRATGGSGLGLAIVKHVLQRHGAELEVQSEEGQGSTFTCHFPASRLDLPVTRVASG